jgi:hypothetical protein
MVDSLVGIGEMADYNSYRYCIDDIIYFGGIASEPKVTNQDQEYRHVYTSR